MLTITGASDDLIEIDGYIREEFTAMDYDGILAVSDGTLLRVKYDDDGIWRFNLMFRGNLYEHKQDGNVEDDTFDIVYFKEGVKWVTCNNQFASVAVKEVKGK